MADRHQNLVPTRHAGFKDIVKWAVTRRPVPWPKPFDAPPGPPPPARVGPGELRATFVGHATVLVQLDGLNLLTDPVWSRRCSPVQWAGPRRVRPPGLRLDDLPPLDAVLLSHNHYDHLDAATARALAQRHPQARWITGLGHAALLASFGVRHVTELAWWQSTDLSGPAGPARVTFVPAQHFSGRGLFDRDRALWGGHVVASPAGPLFFAGDTGYGPHFADIAARLGPPRLALLPIGAYAPRWVMKQVHMDPAEAVQAHLDLRAAHSLSIHYGTFRLTDEAFDAPQADLAAALTAASVDPATFWVLPEGTARALPSVPVPARATP